MPLSSSENLEKHLLHRDSNLQAGPVDLRKFSVFARLTFLNFSGYSLAFAHVVLPLIAFLFRGYTGVGLIEDEAD